jgi:hypothetical protein
MNKAKNEINTSPNTGWRSKLFGGGAPGLVPRWFCLSAGLILLLTGLAKVLSTLSISRMLDVADPVFGLKFRHLFMGVGLLELGAAFLILLTDLRPRLKLLLIAWLSTNFVIYRAGLWLMDWRQPCNCLGTLTDFLHLSPTAADWLMKAALAYMLFGAFAFLLRDFTSERVLARRVWEHP